MTQRIPLPPYPNGWFAIAHADEIAPGQIKAVTALGQELVVLRDMNGKAHVLDAYCPHLGAHLAQGGKVVGDAVQCPFHGWVFDAASGQCKAIPYAKKIPARAAVKTWPVLERNGLIFFHHHLEGAAPTWEPQIIPELSDPDFVQWGKREWEVPTHPQEIMENGVDWAHFETLHGWKVKKIHWTPDGPYYSLKIDVDTGADEQAQTAANADEVNSYNSGPGFLFTRAVGTMHGIVVNCLTPIAPERLRLLHIYYFHKDCAPAVYEGFMEGYLRDWALDIPIWSTKVFRPRPVLADGDGPHFGQFRKWYRQFYSPEVELPF